MDPEKWYEMGMNVQNLRNRLAYYEGGLKKERNFHPWAWRGIGDVLWKKIEPEKALAAYAKSQFPEAKVIKIAPLTTGMGLDKKMVESFKQTLLGRVVALNATFDIPVKAFFHLEVRITTMEPNGPCIVGGKTTFHVEEGLNMRPIEAENDFARLDAGGQISELAQLIEKLGKNLCGKNWNAETEKWSLLALQRAKEGNMTGAITAYQEAMKTSTEWETYLGYGQLLLSAGRVRDAIATYNFILYMDVDMPEYLEKIAQVFYRHKEYDSLAKCSEKILRLLPGNPFAWTMLGHARMGKGRLAEAIAAYEKPLAVIHDQATLWANMVIALIQANRTSEGFYCMEKAIQLDPKLNLGYF